MEREEGRRDNTSGDKGHVKIVCIKPIVADKEVTSYVKPKSKDIALTKSC